jgi:hypothetical protein
VAGITKIRFAHARISWIPNTNVSYPVLGPVRNVALMDGPDQIHGAAAGMAALFRVVLDQVKVAACLAFNSVVTFLICSIGGVKVAFPYLLHILIVNVTMMSVIVLGIF